MPKRRERQVIPAGASPALKIEVGESSGIHVRGADRSDFEVVLCKAAPTRRDWPRSPSRSQAAPDGPRPGERRLGRLPPIAAPRAASIDVDAENGPISLRARGPRRARSENGPISIRDSAGDIDAEAQNGPIAVQGDAGQLRVPTENGPIAVALTGAGWNGEGLDARAVNGPVGARHAGRLQVGDPWSRSGTRPSSAAEGPARGCAALGRRAQGPSSATGRSSCGSRRETGRCRSGPADERRTGRRRRVSRA